TREIRTALGLATILEDAETEFEAQYQLWKIALARGDEGAAHVALQAAAHLLTRFDGMGERPDEVRAAVAVTETSAGRRRGRPKGGRTGGAPRTGGGEKALGRGTGAVDGVRGGRQRPPREGGRGGGPPPPPAAS